MFALLIVGPPGSGKSWVSMLIGYLLDRGPDGASRFNVERICFDPLTFQKWLSEGSRLPKGTVIIADDAGGMMSSRESLTLINRMLSKEFQSMRYKNLIIILNLPHKRMIDVHVRSLMDDTIEVVARREGKNICKLHALQLNQDTGDMYRHGLTEDETNEHPICGLSITQRRKVFVEFERPPREITTAYEKRKKELLDKQGEDRYEAMQRIEQLKKGRKQSIYHTVLKVVEVNPKRFMDEKGKVTTTKILDEFDGEEGKPTCSLQMAYTVARKINESNK